MATHHCQETPAAAVEGSGTCRRDISARGDLWDWAPRVYLSEHSRPPEAVRRFSVRGLMECVSRPGRRSSAEAASGRRVWGVQGAQSAIACPRWESESL